MGKGIWWGHSRRTLQQTDFGFRRGDSIDLIGCKQAPRKRGLSCNNKLKRLRWAGASPKILCFWTVNVVQTNNPSLRLIVAGYRVGFVDREPPADFMDSNFAVKRCTTSGKCSETSCFSAGSACRSKSCSSGTGVLLSLSSTTKL